MLGYIIVVYVNENSGVIFFDFNFGEFYFFDKE